MTLNFGAGGELPICHSSISRPKNRVPVSGTSLSQSSAAQCWSVKLFAIHTSTRAQMQATG